MTKILVISDTHGLQGLIGCLPEAEILIHAGDFMNYGTKISEALNFNSWLKDIPIKHKLVCGGNHDRLFELQYSSRNLITGGIYLENESIAVEGIKFYFSPYTPAFNDWAFNMTREQLKENWKKIPDDTEFLVTHGPPYGILDQAVKGGEHFGDIELLHRVKQLTKLKYHVFGHIHGSRGIAPSVWGPTFVNASFLNEQYRPHSGPEYTLLEVE
jgi:Icc-related predicted phosphoesterase